jgi:uncharacterized protein CbrC (UPF0167 family)
MGSIFPLIADDALRVEDAEYYIQCHVCSTEGVPLYHADGCVIDDSGEADEDNEVYAVCERCIKAGRVEHASEYVTDEVLEKHAENPDTAKALLRATPRIPLFLQDDDWAICCGQLAEFVGIPTSLDDLIELEETAQPWNHGPTSYQRDFANTGPPESFREISVFCCVKCQKRLYVDQFT